MRERNKRILALLFVCYVLAACSLVRQTTEDVMSMSQKEKAAWMMGVFNRQYDNYLIQSRIANLTEGEKDTLRKKKEVLVMVYPLIITYDMFQNREETVSPEAEASIFGLLAQLEHLVVRRVVK